MSGIEIFGVIAGVVQLADVGARLSVKLLSFADKIREISKEVALTCTVLQELSNELHKNDQARLCSDRAVKTADEVVKECRNIFGELQAMLDDDAQARKSLYRKWTQPIKYPALEQKVELLRSNLERLKSTLLLMLNVIIYAGQLKANEELLNLTSQKDLIQRLDDEKKVNELKFTQLTKVIDELTLRQQRPNRASQREQRHQFSKSIMSLKADTSIHNGNPGPRPHTNLARTSDSASNGLLPGHEKEMRHYCALFTNLVDATESAEHEIDTEMRIRIHAALLNIHGNEFPKLHAVSNFAALSLALSLLPIVAHFPVIHAMDAVPIETLPIGALELDESVYWSSHGHRRHLEELQILPSKYVPYKPSFSYSNPLQAALDNTSDDSIAAQLLRQWIEDDTEMSEDLALTRAPDALKALKRPCQD